jgi:predicted amidohydrolase YtcJ
VDKIFYNTRVYTLAEPGAWASAFLVRDGRIAALGTRDSLEAVAYRPRYIDLGGTSPILDLLTPMCTLQA